MLLWLLQSKRGNGQTSHRFRQPVYCQVKIPRPVGICWPAWHQGYISSRTGATPAPCLLIAMSAPACVELTNNIDAFACKLFWTQCFLTYFSLYQCFGIYSINSGFHMQQHCNHIMQVHGVNMHCCLISKFVPFMLATCTLTNNKWSKNFDKRPHCPHTCHPHSVSSFWSLAFALPLAFAAYTV